MTQADVPTKDVTWLERKIATREPDEGQLTAIIRLSRLPQSSEGVSPARMISTLNRVPEMCRMLMANEADQEWLEDGIAFSKIKVDQLPEFLFEVINTWWGEGTNRRTRRAAKKTTTARLTR